MPFRFPYQYGFVDDRKIPYPIVPVQFHTIRGLRAYSFIMDTGADTLTLPNYMMTLLGIKRPSLRRSLMQGIGANLVSIWEGTIPITFCQKTFLVHCSFTEHDTTPFLLGKEGIFKRFSVTFDNDQKMTIFQERKSE